MKIIYLHQYFNTPKMSGGTRSYEMARRLVAAGHEVHMITSDRSLNRAFQGWKEEEIEGINVCWYSNKYSNSFGIFRRLLAFFQFAFATMRKVRTMDADLIFATSTPLTIAIPGVYASKSKSVPLVFEVRDLWPELPIALGVISNPLMKFLAYKLESFAYHNSDQIIALSQDMANGVAKTGYPKDKITIVTNISDPKRFRDISVGQIALMEAYPQFEKKKIVLYAGTMGVVNGVGYLVDIAKAMSALDSEIVFLVIGDGVEKMLVVEKARKLKVLNVNFWHLPRISKEEMPEYFALSSIGCTLLVDIPEIQSSSPNKYFDTLAAGRPIMTNFGGWQANEIRQHHLGIVIPPNDPESAAQILKDFLDDENAVQRSRAASGQLANSKYDADILFEDFRKTLEVAFSDKQH